MKELDAHVNAVTKADSQVPEEADEEEESEEEEVITGPPYSHEAELSLLRCYDEVLRNKLTAAYPKYKRFMRPTQTPNRALLLAEQRTQKDNSFFITQLENMPPKPPIISRKSSNMERKSHRHQSSSKTHQPAPPASVSDASKPGSGHARQAEAEASRIMLKTRERIYRAGTLMDFLRKDLGETVTNPRCITPESGRKRRPARPRSRSLVREYNLWTNTWARRK